MHAWSRSPRRDGVVGEPRARRVARVGASALAGTALCGCCCAGLELCARTAAGPRRPWVDGPFVVPSPRFVWVLKGGAGAEQAFILVLDPGRVACPATARHQGLYHSVQYVL